MNSKPPSSLDKGRGEWLLYRGIFQKIREFVFGNPGLAFMLATIAEFGDYTRCRSYLWDAGEAAECRRGSG